MRLTALDNYFILDFNKSFGRLETGYKFICGILKCYELYVSMAMTSITTRAIDQMFEI